MDLIYSELRPEEVSRWRASLVHSQVVVGGKHANGVSSSGAAEKGATQDGGPESRNFRSQSTPGLISCNKGECKAFGSEACARGRLRREEEGRQQPAPDWTGSRGGSSSTVAEAAATAFLTRRAIQKLFV